MSSYVKTKNIIILFKQKDSKKMLYFLKLRKD